MDNQPNGFAPDPESAVDVLAFVLCPAKTFSPQGDGEELEAVEELMRPIKEAAIKKWAEAARRRVRC